VGKIKSRVQEKQRRKKEGRGQGISRMNGRAGGEIMDRKK